MTFQGQKFPYYEQKNIASGGKGDPMEWDIHLLPPSVHPNTSLRSKSKNIFQKMLISCPNEDIFSFCFALSNLLEVKKYTVQ